MNRSRKVSKFIEDSMLDGYSKGILVNHTFKDKSGMTRTYRSMPDCEAVLASVNAFQDDERLMEYTSMFSTFSKYEGSETDLVINGLKITHPHSSNHPDLPPPHPNMTDQELMKYIWPNADMSKNNGDYVGTLWIDIGSEDVEHDEDENEDGTYSGSVIKQYEWKKVLDYPIPVGSNKCNVAIMRSYLEDEDPKIRLRAKDVLERIAKYDADYMVHKDKISYIPYVPDGYSIIGGAMKSVKISDKLQMNMMYTIESPGSKELDIYPIRNIICEVRSINVTLGLTYHKVFLSRKKDQKKTLKITDKKKDIQALYNSIVLMTIDSALSSPMNIFNIIRGYATILSDPNINDDPLNIGTLEDEEDPSKGYKVSPGQEAINILYDEIASLGQNDQDIMRAISLTKEDAETNSDKNIVDILRTALVKTSGALGTEASANAQLVSIIKKKLFPHCEHGRDTYDTFISKVRYLALMVVELILAVTGRKELSNRKCFSFKRWEPIGYRHKEYIRSLLMSEKDINMMYKKSANLLHFMKQNQYPVKYTRKGTFRQEKSDHKDGIVDNVVKYNYVSMLDSVRMVKITLPGARTSGVNTGDSRELHTSQQGYQCFANTPENANIGLNNNLAEAALITDDLTVSEKEELMEVIDNLEDTPEEEGGVLLLLDGCPYKYVDPEVFYDLKNMRMKGSISRVIGLAFHSLWVDQFKTPTPIIVVRTSHGRPIVPLIHIDRSKEKVNEILSLIDKYDTISNPKNKPTLTLDDLISMGYVEFIDGYEMVYNCSVADWIYAASKNPDIYTHCMIKPNHIFSQATNCLPFIEHDPAARQTYATLHVKQAIGRPFKYHMDRYDHELNYLNNPQPPIMLTDTAKRLGLGHNGIGRVVSIACMSYPGANDDALVMTESFYNSKVFAGLHYNIFTTDRNVANNAAARYNYMIDKDTLELVKSKVTGEPLPDPDFSDSIIVPYGNSYVEELSHDEFENLEPSDLVLYRLEPEVMGIPKATLYELKPGHLYVRYGFRRIFKVTYKDDTTGKEETREIVPGVDIMKIPGKTIVPNGKYKGPIIHKFALVAIHKNHRYDILSGDNDTTFLTLKGNYYIPVKARVPRIKGGEGGNMAHLLTIRERRRIKRGDTAVKIVVRENDKIIGTEKEKFDITYGFIENINYGINTKIKGAMPINCDPGNKFAALHAQKGVNAKIIKDEDAPRARWYNPTLGKYEEKRFDIIFNPLSFPSRMTIGMEYDIIFNGTIKYLYGLQYEDGKKTRTYKDIYETDRELFDQLMLNNYGVEEASDLLDELTDATIFIYDDKKERLPKIYELRNKLGIPEDSYYKLYLYNPDTKQWDREVETPIYCGDTYYVALRHLVANKRRARGYVGKKDPLTLQPVKGRRRDGGANTGTQETDIYKAHGAAGLLYDRMAKVSDFKVIEKCSLCGGAVSTTPKTDEKKCMDCDSVLQKDQVIVSEGVFSWHLFRQYCRALGIELSETFE